MLNSPILTPFVWLHLWLYEFSQQAAPEAPVEVKSSDSADTASTSDTASVNSKDSEDSDDSDDDDETEESVSKNMPVTHLTIYSILHTIPINWSIYTACLC